MRPGAIAALALAALAASRVIAASPGMRDLVVVGATVIDGHGDAAVRPLLTIRDGLVSGDDHAPSDALRIDGRGLFVMPGMVDLRSGAGLPRSANEEDCEVCPDVRALDLVQPDAPGWTEALRAGVTTVVVAPGGRAVVSGIATALTTEPGPLDARVLVADAALVLTLGIEPSVANRIARFQTPYGLHFRRPGNRMGVVSEIRRAFGAARERPETAPDALVRVLRGTLPAWIRARTQQDVLTALQLGRELGVRPVILEATEAHRIAGDVAAARSPVVLGPFYESPRDTLEGWEGEDMRVASPKLLTDAGVTVAIATGPLDPPGTLRDRAILAWRHGLDARDALAAVTSVPARILGMAGRVGDLAPGCRGDLVVLDGPPLQPGSRVLEVVIGGRVAWRNPEAAQPVLSAPATQAVRLAPATPQAVPRDRGSRAPAAKHVSPRVETP